jgi:uncharacterized membrane protein YdfJ with MMPL/SSD domain
LAFVPLRPFREFALAMAVGIMVDVFVVRSLLVPSLISVIGQTSGWPGRALRRVAPTTPRPAPTPSPRRRSKAASLSWTAAALAVYLLDKKRSRRRKR